MNATDDRAKYLKNEIAAFESRLSTVRAEVDSLNKTKETLQSGIEDIKAKHNKEVEEKHIAIRSSSSAIDSARAQLEVDKQDFEKILIKFKQDKVAFERERQSVLDLKAAAQRGMDQVGVFIRLVRDGAAKL